MRKATAATGRRPTRGAARPAAPVKARRPRAVVSDRPAPELSPKQARELRAKAHALEPLVHVGHGGVSEAIVRAVATALRDHELIKVRLHEPEDKHAMAAQIAEAARAALCGLVGHTLILYRPQPKPKGQTSGVARSSIRRKAGVRR